MANVNNQTLNEDVLVSATSSSKHVSSIEDDEHSECSASDETAVVAETNGIDLEKAQTRNDNNDALQAPQLLRTTTSATNGPPYSVFTKNQKRFIVSMASWAGFFSPVSGQIYFPALNSLARSLHVSSSLINLTLTSYMIFQGLAPAFIGSFADSMGRRPAYTICFVIYIAANIGLALQDSYAALMVLRCIQSSGSSATIAMASAVVADVSTPAERGKYMGFTLAGSLLGPAIGPVIGGILAQFLGWRAIFWFLTILAGAFLVIFLVFFPETARTQVGNGSIPPEGWNMSLMNYLVLRKARREALIDESAFSIYDSTVQAGSKKKLQFPNPLASLKIMLDKQVAIILLYNALLFAAFYDVTATIPSQFAEIYGFNALQIGLCFIPFGVGSMLAALVNGQLLDRNFARWCKKLGLKVRKGRDMDLRDFPIERVRLELAMPAIYISTTLVIIFGWVMDVNGPLAAQLVILFFASFTMTIAFNVTSTLLVDFYPTKPATATAANNLARCLLGAGATAAVIPMIDAMGRGWTFTLVGLLLYATSPLIWLNFKYGMKWREERRLRDEARASKETAKMTARNQRKQDRQSKGEQPVAEGGLPDLGAVAEEQQEKGKQY